MFWIQETNVEGKNDPNYKLYNAETVDDIVKLPTMTHKGTQTGGSSVLNDKCSLGCECDILSTGERYILNSSNEWVINKATPNGGGSGGGGGGTTIDYTQLTNLPTINGKTLIGNMTNTDLGLEEDMDLSVKDESLVLSDAALDALMGGSGE